ncbi:MAG: hypothetical protein K2O70_07125 [Desulfovibrionaceae bacterium]|nr:hypothetical protein [Desulfovibrionaceae bacterium]
MHRVDPFDDGLTWEQALSYLPAEHLERVALQAARLKAMEAARGAVKSVPLIMRANYAQEIAKTTNFLITGTKEYARVCRAIQCGDKRRTAGQAQKILERLVLPAALENLDHPRFHPIQPWIWPGYQPERERPRINERGRRIECCHTLKGIPVWIEYDALNQEPSYWICYAPEEKYPYIGEIHYWNPTEAVDTLLRRLHEYRQTRREWKYRRYSLSELRGKRSWELFEIAQCRNIGIKGKSIARLRAEIAQPQMSLW